MASTSISTLSIPSVQSPENKKVVNNTIGLSEKLIEKQTSIKDMFTINLSRRLALRKELHNHLSFLNDIMCFLGLFGIVLMVVANEIVFIKFNHEDTIFSWSIKLLITASTIILIILVLLYHRLELALYSVNNCVVDWRIGLTSKKLFLIALEVIICAIHPIPRSFPNDWYTATDKLTMDSKTGGDFNSTILHPYAMSYTSIDVILSVSMFARLYLLCRFIVYRSHLVRDTSSQSLGYFNKVSINLHFVIKSSLERWPIRCLSIFCILMFFVGSWCLRACDYQPTLDYLPILDAMWLFSATFTTVGYGDLTPVTYCGRSVAVIISIFGILLSALLITVLTQKLTLTRREKYVHNFVLNTQLAKRHKFQAANVIKYALKIWKLDKINEPLSSVRYVQAQQKLFQSIHIIHKIKNEQRKLADNNIDLYEMMTVQRSTDTIAAKTKQKMTNLELKMDKLDKQLNSMNYTIYRMQNTLNRLVDKVTT